MIVPNISFDPEIDDLTTLFSSVFQRVEKQLELYDKVESKFQDSLKFNEPHKLKTKMSKVRTDIISSQNQTDLITKEVDSMNQWMISLEEQKKTIMKIDNIKIPDGFIQKFSTNSAMMKEFEHDLLFYLRNYINSYETPQVLRLKECFKRAFKSKIDRLEMYETISDRYQQADKKFIEVDAENKILTAECQKSDETLARFSTSEAYSLVQKAKRQKFIVEDWAKRKKEIIDQIDTLKMDLEMYKEDNKDKSSNISITRKVQEVDDDYSKSLSKWNEQIRLVEEDFKVSITHQQSMMKQLEKDLLSSQLQLLASQKKKAMTEFRAMQANSTRTVSKFTSNRHSLNRKIEASFRKKALSFHDAVELLKAFHTDELASLKTIMDGVVEDIRNVIKMRKDDSDNSTSSYLTKIQNQIELLRATTETAKRRINMQNIEKDIELKAINNRLVTVQGVVNDVFEHCSECELLHSQLEEKLREISAKKNELCLKMKKEIEENQTFINSVNFLIIRFNDYFEKIEAKSTERNSGDDLYFSKKFKEKVLKRSFSMDRFKKFSFEEIVEYRDKRRFESKKNENEKENSIFKSKEINNSNFQSNKNISHQNKNSENSLTPIKNQNNLSNLNINQNTSLSIQKVESSTSKNISEKIENDSIQSEKENPNKPIQSTNQESIHKFEEKSSTSQKVSPDLQFLTPPKKNFLIPQPPTALSPVPPAKRKILTLSSSAASLCGQIAIIDHSEESCQIVDRGIKLDVEEEQLNEKEIEKEKENKNEVQNTKEIVEKKEIITQKVVKNPISNNNIKNTINNNNNNNDKNKNNKNIEIKNTKIETPTISKEKVIPILTNNDNNDNDNSKSQNPDPNKSNKTIPVSLPSIKSEAEISVPNVISDTFSSSHQIRSSTSSEKVKTKPKIKAKNRESASSLSSLSSSSASSTNIVKVSNIKNDTSKDFTYFAASPKNSEKNDQQQIKDDNNNSDHLSTENNSDNQAQIFEFKLNPPKVVQPDGKESSTGRIKIEYDKSLTATVDKKKKKKISISPRRKKPPKQIPNEQPSFVNNRPPRHLTLTTPSGYKNVFIRNNSINNNNNNLNVKIININESVSTQIPAGMNGFLNEENTEKLDVDDSKISKKKTKKLSVKKKSKKNTDYYLKKKKAADQKINGKVLAFSLPTAERRALSVKNVPRNGIADSMVNNGSLNLNNRINGSIISVQHF